MRSTEAWRSALARSFHFLPATNGKYFFELSVEQIQWDDGHGNRLRARSIMRITASCVRECYGEMAGVAKPAVHSPTWLCTINNIAATRART